VEKLDYLVWRSGDLDEQVRGLLSGSLLLPVVRRLTVSTADTDEAVPRPLLLMGRGAELAALVEVWLDSLDQRVAVEELLGPADGYLVTESVPQLEPLPPPVGSRSPGLTHLTWFPKPERLSDEEFYRGWHDVHTPSSFDLHPRRDGYVRDAVARVLTPGAPPVRAIVSEHFPEVEDYTDPSRLFGSPEALTRTMEELPLYGDQADMSSRPLWRHVLR
jgi:hypothetical protein